jgi:hypothetical protein
MAEEKSKLAKMDEEKLTELLEKLLPKLGTISIDEINAMPDSEEKEVLLELQKTLKINKN